MLWEVTFSIPQRAHSAALQFPAVHHVGHHVGVGHHVAALHSGIVQPRIASAATPPAYGPAPIPDDFVDSVAAVASLAELHKAINRTGLPLLPSPPIKYQCECSRALTSEARGQALSSIGSRRSTPPRRPCSSYEVF